MLTRNSSANSHIKEQEAIGQQMAPTRDRQEEEAKKQQLEVKIREELEPYAQAICQHFCKKLLAKLPRELRDMVYEYVVAPDYIYVCQLYLNKIDQPCEIDRGAHWWDANFVGHSMQIELVQTWYRVSLFYFWERAKNVEVINRFMTFDRWGLGLQPYQWMSRVRFDLGDDKFHTQYCQPHHHFQQYPATLTAPLRALHQFRFPQRVRFLIRIHTYGSLENRCLKGKDLRDALEEVVANLQLLCSARHRFFIQWSEIGNLEFDSKNCTFSSGVWHDKIVMQFNVKELNIKQDENDATSDEDLDNVSSDDSEEEEDEGEEGSDDNG